MRQLIIVISLIIPGMVFAHPGHAVTEQLHTLIHSEHLLVLLSIVVVAAVIRIIKKLFF